MDNIIVSKFGGSSMANYESMSNCIELICKRKSNLIILSAVYGTTDKLVELIQIALNNSIDDINKKLFALKEIHLDIIYKLKESNQTKASIKDLFLELETILMGIHLLKECSPKAQDKILSFGERMSTVLFKSLLKEKTNKDVSLIDSKDYIKTDSHFTEATPNIELIKKECSNIKFTPNTYTIAAGFISSNDKGETTTLGRGGSDYSAALYAEALQAKRLEIWTDVQGVFTIDPRISSNYKHVENLSYDEASEFALLGAKILHPISIIPAKRSNIDVIVGSSQHKDTKTTKISKELIKQSKYLGITYRKEQVLLYFKTEKMHTLLEFFEKNKLNSDTLSLGYNQASILVDQKNLNDDFLNQAQELGLERKLENKSLISIIARELNQINHTRLLSELENYDFFISRPNNLSLNICINQSDMNQYIKKAHDLLLENGL